MDVVRRLLDAGADPNARGGYGLTARGIAHHNGHARTEAALTAAGGEE